MAKVKKPVYNFSKKSSILAEKVFEDFSGNKSIVYDNGEWRIVEIDRRNLYFSIKPDHSCTDYPVLPVTIVAGFEIPGTGLYTGYLEGSSKNIFMIGVEPVKYEEQEKIKKTLKGIAQGPVSFWS